MFKQKQNMKINVAGKLPICTVIGFPNGYNTTAVKVFETKDYFYLYLDEDTAFLVSKSGFKIGTPKDFSEFIKKKCIFKYSKEK